MKIKNKTLLIFLFFDFLFLCCAVLMIAVPTLGQKAFEDGPTVSSVAQVLLLDECPLTAATVNGVFMLIAFALSIPGITLKQNRSLLTIQAWLLIGNALFTLAIGVAVWYPTLQTKAHIAPIWDSQTLFVQSMLQNKFQCCGFTDTVDFITDHLCTSADVAATKGACLLPFRAFANNFLDVVFTSMFGFCVVDVLLFFSVLCVLKDRAEKARYQRIDEKRLTMNYGYGRF